jgi:peptide deformylase
MKLPICYYGNPILRQKSQEILEVTTEIRKFVLDMIETCDINKGIGLAAVQVGRAISLFILRRYIVLSDTQTTVSDPVVYINPKILKTSVETDTVEEGCLSIPGILVPVHRPLRIQVASTRLSGQRVVEDLEGMNARVVLHENDHLNGILIIDHIKKSHLKEIEGKLIEIKEKLSRA